MNELKRKAIENALLAAGDKGVERERFEADRLAYGTAFMRRLEELEEIYTMDKEINGRFIKKWTITGRRNLFPIAADVPREIYIGTVCSVEWFEVLA